MTRQQWESLKLINGYPIKVNDIVFDRRLIYTADPSCEERYQNIPGRITETTPIGFSVKWEPTQDRSSYESKYSWNFLIEGEITKEKNHEPSPVS